MKGANEFERGAEERLRHFEAAWKAGPPDLARFLPPLPERWQEDPALHFLVVELVAIDLEYRWRLPASGGAKNQRPLPPLLDDYVRVFPRLGPLERLPVELIVAEYDARRLAGASVSLEDLVARFPGCADVLGSVLRQREANQPPTVEATLSDVETTIFQVPGGTLAEALLLLQSLDLLGKAQIDEVSQAIDAGRLPTLDALLNHALERSWLTEFQVAQLRHGRGTDLVQGPYVLQRLLGEGGMSKVYLARHRRMNRTVAFKVLRRQLIADAGEVAVRRFYQEIQAIGRLSHPNIVHAYDAGPVGATHFLAMEYVDGIDLGRLVRGRGPLPVDVEVLFATDEGTLSTDTDDTGGAGNARATLTSGTLANVPAQVTASATISGTLYAAALSVPILPTEVELTTSSGTLLVGQTAQLTVNLTFNNGVVVKGHTIGWRVSPGKDGDLTKQTSTTDSTGTTTNTLTAQRGGNGTVIADDMTVFLVPTETGMRSQDLLAAQSQHANQHPKAQVAERVAAPVADINIKGVRRADKITPGGFVAVNANNQNGSKLTYANGRTVPNGKYGIPATRDFQITMPTEYEDDDLVEVSLETNLPAGARARIVLSVVTVKDGRGQIRIWDTKKKTNKIVTPTNWIKATMPPKIYLEGLLEGAALGEISLELVIRDPDNMTPLAMDKATVTVTPVLTNLVVTPSKGAVPSLIHIGNPPIVLIASAVDLMPAGTPAVTIQAAAQWNAVRGQLRFIQDTKNINNFTIPGRPGKWGATLGPRKWDFADPGTTLVDSRPESLPFYTLGENLTLRNDIATNSVIDTPSLPLSIGPNEEWIHSVLPAVGNTTKVDVTYWFETHATVAFSDKSIYCIGMQWWTVRFAGKVTQPMALRLPRYFFAPSRLHDAVNGSTEFESRIRNNANPAATGDTTANRGGGAWR